MVNQMPSSIIMTLIFMESIRVKELEKMKEAIMFWRLETWPGLALDSSHGNLLSAQKLKFLIHLEDNPSAFSIWKAAVRFWLNSTNNIPTDPKAFLQPVKAHMVNAEYGNEFHLPKDGSSSSSRGQILPDICSSPSSKLFQSLNLGPTFRTLVRFRTFLMKVVRKWSEF